MTERKESPQYADNIRSRSAEILSQSTDLIRINADKLESTVVPRLEQFARDRQDGNYLPIGSELTQEQEVGLNLFYNVINFCYQDPETGNEYTFQSESGKTVKRSTGLLTALYESGIDWNDLCQVSALTPDRWQQICQSSAENPLYLAEDRGSRLVELADYLLEEGHQTVDNFIVDCDFDAQRIIDKLLPTGLFDDEFLKRAQLAGRMINDVMIRRTKWGLSGIREMTIMADYRLPQVFYNLGALDIVDPSMLTALVEHQPIAAGSREELALRAASIALGEQIANKMDITEAWADNLLWGLSQEMAKNSEMAIPHMIVATDAY